MEKENWKVYKLTNPVNGKIYIGCTCKKLEFRWNHGKGYWYHENLYRDIQTIGWDNFAKEILELCDDEVSAQRAEQKWIDYYESMNPDKGYNRTAGGKGMLGWHHTEESVEKIKVSNQTRVISEETRQKQREAHLGKYNGENNPFWSKTHNEETRKRISEANTGRTHCPISEEHRKKLREIHTGKTVVFSDEWRRKHAESMRGHGTSVETREKMRNRVAGEKNPMYRKIPITATGVIQYDKQGNEIARYPSATHAKRATGISNVSIGKCCKGEAKSAGGYIWKYDTLPDGGIKHPSVFAPGNQPIAQYDLEKHLIGVFTNVYEIEKELGFSRHQIVMCCQNKLAASYGFIWRFVKASEEL